MPDYEDRTPLERTSESPFGQPAWAAAPPPPPDPLGAPPPWTQTAQSAPPRSASPGTAPLYDLRPLSTGEILDRTFSVYRKRFWLFAGLAVVASATTTLSTFVQLTWGTVHTPKARVVGADPFAIFRGPEFQVLVVTLLVTIVAYFFVYSLTQAATVHAVSEVYLGRETTMGASFRSVRQRWFRYCAIAFWQGWSYLWLPLTLILLAGGVAGIGTVLHWEPGVVALLAGLLIVAGALSVFYGIYAYMRNSLGIVAAVTEDLRVKDALVRSKQLTQGRVARVLALLLLLFVLSMAASVARAIPSFFLGLAFARSSTALAVILEGVTLVTTFVTGVLLLPVGAIAFCLFYIDERVRREGFDVETLLGLGAPAAGAAPAEPLASPFSGAGLV